TANVSPRVASAITMWIELVPMSMAARRTRSSVPFGPMPVYRLSARPDEPGAPGPGREARTRPRDPERSRSRAEVERRRPRRQVAEPEPAVERQRRGVHLVHEQAHRARAEQQSG